MSLLLYGPPGTAKTTIAERIAAELQWPLLKLDPSRLLSSGVDGIATEAENLFELLPHLRNVVVLFDEFEGVFLKRASSVTDMSRFLTTSMLPRLHHLRDSERIVFIIATNDRRAIDPAAYRPGRIDEHIEVGPPDGKAALQIALNISRTVAKHVLPINAVGHGNNWDQLWEDIARRTSLINKLDGLTPAYIVRWVDSIALGFNSNYTVDMAIDELEGLKKRHADELSETQREGYTR
ncbi:ATP-binding protein [Nocardioides sp. W3-2-3]|uniref:ATP-binding protein n=1 Tax=Nocardioides convexus TaxID=2712224 RepID=UPI00241844DB|nr:ATP-binding protein [Nocardioides convexus]NHA00605.1 ATP-binding protein [Nocardioides convexus]